jgi:hypothetical protein
MIQLFVRFASAVWTPKIGNQEAAKANPTINPDARYRDELQALYLFRPKDDKLRHLERGLLTLIAAANQMPEDRIAAALAIVAEDEAAGPAPRAGIKATSSEHMSYKTHPDLSWILAAIEQSLGCRPGCRIQAYDVLEPTDTTLRVGPSTVLLAGMEMAACAGRMRPRRPTSTSRSWRTTTSRTRLRCLGPSPRRCTERPPPSCGSPRGPGSSNGNTVGSPGHAWAPNSEQPPTANDGD